MNSITFTVDVADVAIAKPLVAKRADGQSNLDASTVRCPHNFAMVGAPMRRQGKQRDMTMTTRELDPGTQVWRVDERAPDATVWIIERLEGTGYRCWRHDGQGGRIVDVFRADEIENANERHARREAEDAAGKPPKKRDPLYPA